MEMSAFFNRPMGERPLVERSFKLMVGVRGFEPPTPSSRTSALPSCATHRCLGARIFLKSPDPTQAFCIHLKNGLRSIIQRVAGKSPTRHLSACLQPVRGNLNSVGPSKTSAPIRHHSAQSQWPHAGASWGESAGFSSSSLQSSSLRAWLNRMSAVRFTVSSGWGLSTSVSSPCGSPFPLPAPAAASHSGHSAASPPGRAGQPKRWLSLNRGSGQLIWISASKSIDIADAGLRLRQPQNQRFLAKGGRLPGCAWLAVPARFAGFSTRRDAPQGNGAGPDPGRHDGVSSRSSPRAQTAPQRGVGRLVALMRPGPALGSVRRSGR